MQLKYKPLQVPDKLPDTEVFGKHDTTEADLVARREHAKRIAGEQLNTVADRKRAEILKRLQDQEEEDDKIRRNKEEWVIVMIVKQSNEIDIKILYLKSQNWFRFLAWGVMYTLLMRRQLQKFIISNQWD